MSAHTSTFDAESMSETSAFAHWLTSIQHNLLAHDDFIDASLFLPPADPVYCVHSNAVLLGQPSTSKGYIIALLADTSRARAHPRGGG
jgi:hypothetical protein